MTSPETSHLNLDNRAYQRFTALLEEHFDVTEWHRNDDPDGVPVMTTVKDLHSGDLFTLALIDSLEETAAAVLLAVADDGHLTAHGPFHDQQAAQQHAPHLALTDPHLANTRACPLHAPDQPASAIPVTYWAPVPTVILAALRPAPLAAGPTILVLLDHEAEKLAVVGPFPDPASADQWQRDSHVTNGFAVPLLRPDSAS